MPLRKNTDRVRQFEEFEKRLVMSAQALTAVTPLIDAETLVQQIETAPAEVESSQLADVNEIREQYGFNGAGQTVAVIDTGIAWDHYALGGGYGEGTRVVGGWDFAENDANPYDDGPTGFHGTHVSGIIGASDAEYSGVASGVDLVSLRVFDDFGGGNLDWVEQALQWVHENKDSFENPITTVNLSLGTTWNATTTPEWAQLEEELATLKADGIFISVAAGNSFQDYNEVGLSYPAVSPSVVPVSSHDANGNISEFSQRASNVLVAPGEDVYSTVPDHLFGARGDGEFLRATGTSQAAPYVAGASALLRQANELVGTENITQDLLYDQFRETADQIYDSATSAYYYRLNLAEAIDSVIEDWHSDFANAATEIGNLIGGELISGLIGNLNDSDHFSFVADKTGEVTLSFETTHDLTPIVDIIGVDSTKVEGNTVTFKVTAGEEYKFSVAGDGALGQYEIDINLREISSPVSLIGGQLVINGTDGDDTFSIRAEDTISVSLNGTNYSYDASDVNGIVLRGNGGNDRLDVQLSDDSQAVAIGEGWLSTTSIGKGPIDTLFANGIETINVDGGGGFDTLVLRDTSGNDLFTNDGQRFQLTGEGQTNTATSFTSVVAYSSGGVDRAELLGTDGDDVFSSRDNTGFLRNSDGQSVSLRGFDRTVVTGQGGHDLANVFDSEGDDRFVVKPTYVFADTDDGRVWASGIERVNVFSRSGNDTVELADSRGNDTFFQNGKDSLLSGSGYANLARGFDNVFVSSIGGTDVAQLSGTAANDVFTARGDETRIESSERVITTDGFDRVNVVANQGGYDRAVLIGGSGVDVLYADRNSSTFTQSSGEIARAVGFDRVDVNGAGGLDLSFIKGSHEAESFRTDGSATEFHSTVQLLRMVQFQQTHFDGNGGADQVVFEDFDELDLLGGLGDQATALLDGNSFTAEDFAFLEAETADGSSSNSGIAAVDFLFNLKGDWHSF